MGRPPRSKTDTIRVTIFMSPELREDLRKIAKDNYRSLIGQVNWILNKYIESES